LVGVAGKSADANDQVAATITFASVNDAKNGIAGGQLITTGTVGRRIDQWLSGVRPAAAPGDTQALASASAIAAR